MGPMEVGVITEILIRITATLILPTAAVLLMDN